MADFPTQEFYEWFKSQYSKQKLVKLDRCIDEYGGLEMCVKEILFLAFDDNTNETKDASSVTDTVFQTTGDPALDIIKMAFSKVRKRGNYS